MNMRAPLRLFPASILLAGMALWSGNSAAYTLDIAGSVIGDNLVIDYSTADGVSFDVEFAANEAVTLRVIRELGDTADLVNLNAVILNFSGVGWSAFSVAATDGAALASAGFLLALTTLEEAVVSLEDGLAVASFPGDGEFSGFELGDVFDVGVQPWLIDVSGVAPGSAFGIELTPTVVPLPAAGWLMGAALAGLGFARRRRDSQLR